MKQIKWSYRSTRDSEFATFTVGKLTCTVQDCDGDCSAWNIREGETVIAQHDTLIYNVDGKYHFDIAKEEAEKALIVEAEKRGLYSH